MGREAVERVAKRIRDTYERSTGRQPDAKASQQIRQHAETIGQKADKKNRRKDAEPVRVRR